MFYMLASDVHDGVSGRIFSTFFYPLTTIWDSVVAMLKFYRFQEKAKRIVYLFVLNVWNFFSQPEAMTFIYL